MVEKEIGTRVNLSYEGLLENILDGFGKVEDKRKNPQYELRDILLAGFAMFSLKDLSLLSFERRFAIDNNLKSVFKLSEIPSDSQMRTVLDEIEPDNLRKPFKSIFAQAQRGIVLESFVSINNSYLMSCDGTSIFSSHKVYGKCCMKKESKEPTYHHQMYAASIVHPDKKEVIPLMPEMIHNHDGDTKNDCELNAAKRFVKSFRREHPKKVNLLFF